MSRPEEQGVDLAQITAMVQADVGSSWDSHYKAVWLERGGVSGLREGRSWNWAAALWSIGWLGYRRRPEAALAILLFYVVFLGLWSTHDWAGYILLAGTIGLFVGLGSYGDRLVLQRAWSRADDALREAGTFAAAQQQVASTGGVSMAGVLAVLAIPVAAAVIFARAIIPEMGRQERNFRTIVISDLIQLRDAQEAFFTDSGRYTTDVAQLALSPSSMVTGLAVTLTDSGWHATASLTRRPDIVCGIAVRSKNPVDSRAVGGEPRCR
jgi:hypothetical protein